MGYRPSEAAANGRFEAPPHPIQLLTTEPTHLARDHVTSAHHQLRLKVDQLLQPLMNSRDVAGGAVAAVEITDQTNPQHSPPGRA